MKRFLTTATIVLAFGLSLASPPAQAFLGLGGIVYDPKNHAQNILTAARSLQQISNQVRQLAHETEMLLNQARDLEALPGSIAGDLQGALAEVDDLLQSAEGLAYQVDAIDAEYQRLFPQDYAEGTPTAELLSDADAAWGLARAGYKHALEVQAGVVGGMRADQTLLTGLLGDSQSAAGNLQALQAGNQLSALATKQSMQIQSLLAAAQRAQALDRAQALAAREQGRARLRQFLGNGTAYTR